MPKKRALKQPNQKSVIYLTFIILFSIPLLIFSILQDDFDIRRRAFDDLELSDQHQCLISFPNVNPYSLEVGKTVSVQVEARIKDDYAKTLEIYDGNGEIIYREVFEASPIEIIANFSFTPDISGKVEMTGIIEKGQTGSVGCTITSPFNIMGLKAIPNNTAPGFTSRPSDSIPSQNILTGDIYEYTLTAEDIDGDNINYSYSFTPRADWLKPIIIDDGSGGKLTIKFRGSTDKAASYLANVLVHDGYSTNVRTQSWVINVSPKENDIPVVRIIDPVDSLRLDKGESFRTAWESTDLNHIVGHELFISNNPTDESEWISVDKNINSNQNDYNVNTSEYTSGTYKLIVRSTDNQRPPASGIGISPEIVVSGIPGEDEEKEKDDGVVLKQPQVVNMSPSSADQISNRKVTVRATIIAGERAEIDEDTITFLLNETDLSDSIRLNRITPSEYTIIYQPEQDLQDGVNQAEISFSDTKGQEVSKSWNFRIDDDDSKDTDTYDIFGYEVSRTVVLIVGVGILTVILALAVPFVIFSIWKGDKRRDDSIPYRNDRLPPSTPRDDTPYTEAGTEEPFLLREKVTTTPSNEEADMWDKYSAPKPEETKDEEDLPNQKLEQEIEDETEIITEGIVTSAPPILTQEEKTTDVQQTQSTPEVQEPKIPEPEIPDSQDLQNIFQQIQEAQNETPEETPPENQIVKE